MLCGTFLFTLFDSYLFGKSYPETVTDKLTVERRKPGDAQLIHPQKQCRLGCGPDWSVQLVLRALAPLRWQCLLVLQSAVWEKREVDG